MYRFLLGFLLGVLLTILFRKVTSSYEPGDIFAVAKTTEDVQKIYDQEMARLTNQANANLGAEDVDKAAAELRNNIANLSGEATKAFARVAPPPAPVASPASAPAATPAPAVMETQAPAPAPEMAAPMAPAVSMYEPEPYY